MPSLYELLHDISFGIEL